MCYSWGEPKIILIWNQFHLILKYFDLKKEADGHIHIISYKQIFTETIRASIQYNQIIRSDEMKIIGIPQYFLDDQKGYQNFIQK
jgi:hypothetical protein